MSVGPGGTVPVGNTLGNALINLGHHVLERGLHLGDSLRIANAHEVHALGGLMGGRGAQTFASKGQDMSTNLRLRSVDVLTAPAQNSRDDARRVRRISFPLLTLRRQDALGLRPCAGVRLHHAFGRGVLPEAHVAPVAGLARLRVGQAEHLLDFAEGIKPLLLALDVRQGINPDLAVIRPRLHLRSLGHQELVDVQLDGDLTTVVVLPPPAPPRRARALPPAPLLALGFGLP
mmetsp:Transcript_21149/g.72811  ORF Transcript_21149/g.72811 Transcript_21149/m.72811 type:complete len:232 (+) Transcript_21149:561-1256(+)